MRNASRKMLKKPIFYRLVCVCYVLKRRIHRKFIKVMGVSRDLQQNFHVIICTCRLTACVNTWGKNISRTINYLVAQWHRHITYISQHINIQASRRFDISPQTVSSSLTLSFSQFKQIFFNPLFFCHHHRLRAKYHQYGHYEKKNEIT